MSQPSHKQENRELLELLNEVRVVVPGVQVLFAFLLTIPLSSVYQRFSSFEKNTYVFAFFATTAAAILLIAPSAYHRLRWRQGDKEALLITSNRVTVVGLVLLGVAMVAVVALVAEQVFSDSIATVMTILVAALILVMWFGIPLSRKYRVGDGSSS